MSDEVRLLLSEVEASAVMLLITLGTDAYEGKLPNFEVIEALNRMPPRAVRSLNHKLEAMASFLDNDNGL